MNSFNHYAYGAVGEWMYRTLAGVSAAEPGYKKILVAPVPGAGITSAARRLQTPYGEVASSRWSGADGFTLDLTVPANTTAIVRIPGTSGERTVASGTYHFRGR